MATITFFGDVSDDSLRSQDPVYIDATNGTGAIVSPGGTSLQIGQQEQTGLGQRRCWESFVAFDTSSIASTPTSAAFSLWGLTDNSTEDFTAEARLLDWGTTLEASDWVLPADMGGDTLLATRTSVSFIVGAYNQFTENGTNLRDNINITGFTRFYIVSDQHRLQNQPGADTQENFIVSSADETGTTQDPILLVTASFESTDSILNPNIDVTTDNWTTDLGSVVDLWAAIDESSPSDTDYLRSPAGPLAANVYETRLEGGIDPGTDNDHILHYRINKNVAGGTGNIDVGLYQGATPIETFNHVNISSTFTTFNQAMTPANVANITDYNDLRIRFTPSYGTSDIVPTFVADRASANSNALVTTVDLALAGMTIGNYLIIRTAADNSGGGGQARSITLTNQVGTPVDTATYQAFQQNNDPGAASAGTTCNFLIAKITDTSGTVRLTYSGSVQQACVAEEWSGIHATTPVVGTPVGANSTASTNLPTLTDASVAFNNVAYAVISNEGPNADVYTGDADAVNGTWVTLTKLGTTDATATDNQTTYAEYKTVTATGSQTHNATRNNARDSAGLIVSLAGAPSIRVQCSWANLELPAAVAVKLQSKLSNKIGQAIKTGAMS